MLITSDLQQKQAFPLVWLLYESLDACSVFRLAFQHALTVKQCCCGAVQQGAFLLVCVISFFVCCRTFAAKACSAPGYRQTEVSWAPRGGKPQRCRAVWTLLQAESSEPPRSHKLPCVRFFPFNSSLTICTRVIFGRQLLTELYVGLCFQ